MILSLLSPILTNKRMLHPQHDIAQRTLTTHQLCSTVTRYRHYSEAVKCEMGFAVYTPVEAEASGASVSNPPSHRPTRRGAKTHNVRLQAEPGDRRPLPPWLPAHTLSLLYSFGGTLF